MGYNIQRQVRVATTATLWHQRAHMRPYEIAVDAAIKNHGKGSPEHLAATCARSAAWREAKDLGPYARFNGAAMAALLAIADHAGEANPADAPEGARIDRFAPGGSREGWALIDTIHGEAGPFSRSAIQQGLNDLRATEFQRKVKKDVDGKMKLVPIGPAIPVKPALLSEETDGKKALTFTVPDFTTAYINRLVREGVAKWDTTASGGRKLVEAVAYVRASSRGHSRPEPVEALEYTEPGLEVVAEAGSAVGVAAAGPGTHGAMFDDEFEYTASTQIEYTPDPDDEPIDGELDDDAFEPLAAHLHEDITAVEIVEETEDESSGSTITHLPVMSDIAEAPEQEALAPVVPMPSEAARAVRAELHAEDHHKEVLKWAETSEHAAAAVRIATERAIAAGIAEPLLARDFGTVAGLQKSDAVHVAALKIAKRTRDAATLIHGRAQWQADRAGQTMAGDR